MGDLAQLWIENEIANLLCCWRSPRLSGQCDRNAYCVEVSSQQKALGRGPTAINALKNDEMTLKH